MGQLVMLMALVGLAHSVNASTVGGTFNSIDGGTISVEAWRGKPVLIVNTASRCGFTGQYDGLQAVYDQYRERGLQVLAVPSNDFRQELASEGAVKEFCEVNFNLDLPMTEITSVRGGNAHPFYKAVREATGFEPRWNFNKILVGPDGMIVGTWGATTKPGSRKITREIEALLN